MRLFVSLSIAAALTLVACASAPAKPQPEHANARLISEHAKLTPGAINWLALDFDIEEGWHLYWDGVNDSGFAPKLNAKATAGATVGELVWPAPKRLVSPGDILDHIYEKHITLLFPLTVPKDAAPGSQVVIEASPEWLVCHDVCLPGSAELKVTLPIAKAGETGAPGPHTAVFSKARERIPKPLPKENPPVRISAVKNQVTITNPGAAELTFYPGNNSVRLPAAIKEAQKKGERLVLTMETQPGKPAILQGVLEVKPASGGPPMLWAIQADLAAANKPVPHPSNPEPGSSGGKN